MSELELLRELLNQLAQLRQSAKQVNRLVYDDLHYHLDEADKILSGQLKRIERDRLAEMRQAEERAY